MKDEQKHIGPKKTQGEVGVTECGGETKCIETSPKKEISNTLKSDFLPKQKTQTQLMVLTPWKHTTNLSRGTAALLYKLPADC